MARLGILRTRDHLARAAGLIVGVIVAGTIGSESSLARLADRAAC
jgi:hypothetical protein